MKPFQINTIELPETSFCSLNQLYHSSERFIENSFVPQITNDLKGEIHLFERLCSISNVPFFIFIIDTSSPFEYKHVVLLRIKCILDMFQHQLSNIMVILYDDSLFEVQLFDQPDYNQIQQCIEDKFIEETIILPSHGSYINRSLQACLPFPFANHDVFLIHFCYSKGITSIKEYGSLISDIEYEQTFQLLKELQYDYWMYCIDNSIEMKRYFENTFPHHMNCLNFISANEKFINKMITKDVLSMPIEHVYTLFKPYPNATHTIYGVVIQIDSEYQDFDTIFNAFGLSELFSCQPCTLEISNSCINQKVHTPYAYFNGCLNQQQNLVIKQFLHLRNRRTDNYIQQLELDSIIEKLFNEFQSNTSMNQTTMYHVHQLFIEMDKNDCIETKLTLNELKVLANGKTKYLLQNTPTIVNIKQHPTISHTKDNNVISKEDDIFESFMHYSLFRSFKRLILFDPITQLDNDILHIIHFNILHESLRFNQIFNGKTHYTFNTGILNHHICNDWCKQLHIPIA
ncbi:Alpha-type protein kinase domain-containing protein [Entamoeba marina]